MVWPDPVVYHIFRIKAPAIVNHLHGYDISLKPEVEMGIACPGVFPDVVQGLLGYPEYGPFLTRCQLQRLSVSFEMAGDAVLLKGTHDLT